MTTGKSDHSLTWAHLGDLHITGEQQPNYQDLCSIIEALNNHLAGHVDFCVLPGDNADDGSSAQYASIRRALDRLKIPIHVIPGDHDRKPGNLRAFYEGLGVPRLPNAVTVHGYRCLFLDVVSHGAGGPDFALGPQQLLWLESELESATLAQQPKVVFMHAYPADFTTEGEALQRLLHEHQVTFVDMGHTHYNELSNDGTTIFATTRSTGQIEEGAVGFSIVSLNGGVVSWRFKPLHGEWPFVMITSPADHRLVTDVTHAEHVVGGRFTVRARVWNADTVIRCRCRIDAALWTAMHPSGGQWELICDAPEQQFVLAVEATDAAGNSGTDSIVVATPGYHPPDRCADGSDADALGAWPERHLLGTRLGPNRNGRQW